jgi:hypothetical protein
MRSLLPLLLSVAACGGPVTPPDAGSDAGIVDAGPDCSGRPADAPARRGEWNGVYDAARGRIVIYGGNTADPVMCMASTAISNELWAFHPDCGSWEALTPGGGPGSRARHATTLDTTRGRMLLFGGRTRAGTTGLYTNFNDVWAFDLATDTWNEITTTGTPPSARSSAVAVYDAPRDRLIVFGGNTSTDGATYVATNDVMELDLATAAWSPINAGAGPDPRLFHAGVVLDEELVIFGGNDNFFGPFFNDTWALDLVTDQWRSVHPGGAGAPEPRFGAEFFADAARHRVVLFGGHDITDLGNRNDVWAFDVTTGEWATVHAGDALNGVPGCPPATDFTIIEPDAPERRYSFAHVQDETGGYVLGGKADCGNLNDVQRLDLETGAWRQLRLSNGGVACPRTGRTTCTDLCN